MIMYVLYSTNVSYLKKILITTLAVVLDKKEKEEKNEKCSIQIVSTVKSTSVPIRAKQKNINIKINNFVS